MAAILAIDQGTTSTRAIIFDGQMQVIGIGQKEFPQHFPRSGWVEHSPEDLWSSTIETCRQALANAGLMGRDLAVYGHVLRTQFRSDLQDENAHSFAARYRPRH